MSSVNRLLALVPLCLLGCDGIAGDLWPSNRDKRHHPPAQDDGQTVSPSTGPGVGQIAPDFSTVDSRNGSVRLSEMLSESDTPPIVLYFTMWCPICNSHMDHMIRNVLPDFPDARFFVVDYISNSVAGVRSNADDNGYADARITVLADLDHAMLTDYDATMGSTIVLDATGTVRMNEDYKNGARLLQVLEDLGQAQ